MHQHHQSTPAGTFWPCSACLSEPRHIITSGRSRRETMKFNIPAKRHSLECRCGRCTGLFADLRGAEADWGQRFAQVPLALPPPCSATTPVIPLNRGVRKRQGVAHA